jgi:hypothetical protein
MMKLTVTFRKFANAPKNSIGLYFAFKKIQQEEKLPNNEASHNGQRTKFCEIF